MASITLLYTPVNSESEAKRIGQAAVEKKLAACANLFPIQSYYHWNAALNEDNEFVLLLKTLPEAVEKLTRFIEEEHPYDVPCILRFQAEVNHAYLEWMQNEVTI